jgi:hypothetical protein
LSIQLGRRLLTQKDVKKFEKAAAGLLIGVYPKEDKRDSSLLSSFGLSRP